MAAPRSATLAVACFCMLAAFGVADAQEVDILSQLFNLDSKVDDGCNKYLLVLTVSTKGPEALAATRWLFAERLAKEVPSAGPRDLIVMALEEKDDSGYVFDPATSICNEELRPGSEFNNKYLQARFRVVPGTQAEYDRIKNYVATSAIVDDVLGRRGACASVAAIERDEIKLKPRCGGTRDGFNSDADIPQREQASATEVRGVDSQDERVANAGAPAVDANVRSSINRPDDDDFAFGW